MMIREQQREARQPGIMDKKFWKTQFSGYVGYVTARAFRGLTVCTDHRGEGSAHTPERDRRAHSALSNVQANSNLRL